MVNGRVHPILLSGGAGTRLWPVSRALYPKQLQRILGSNTLLQDTALRVANDSTFVEPIIISNDDHRFLIASQLKEVGISPQYHVLEPEGRNTAPAIAVAARLVAETDPDGILLVLPADHFISDIQSFRAIVKVASQYAAAGHLVTFGIPPTRPETGYGYIKAGPKIPPEGGYKVSAFREKPSKSVAERYLAEGGYFWNSGMFLFRADALLDEMTTHCPEIQSGVERALKTAVRDLDFLRLGKEAFSATPSDSIDYAVMEKTSRAVVLPVEMGWSDVGSWQGLWELGVKDDAGNVIVGDAVCIDTENSYVRGEGRLIAALGVSDLVIVDTRDALLVADRKDPDGIKRIVNWLNETTRSEANEHLRVYRPWGYYESLANGERHQVKHLMVNPGARLSLQSHRKRSEHWVVVCGTARVTVDDSVRDLKENESAYIPVGAVHRLENPGTTPLSVIEVQSGSYLGEDDIQRFEDDYKRQVEPGRAAE